MLADSKLITSFIDSEDALISGLPMVRRATHCHTESNTCLLTLGAWCCCYEESTDSEDDFECWSCKRLDSSLDQDDGEVFLDRDQQRSRSSSVDSSSFGQSEDSIFVERFCLVPPPSPATMMISGAGMLDVANETEQAAGIHDEQDGSQTSCRFVVRSRIDKLGLMTITQFGSIASAVRASACSCRCTRDTVQPMIMLVYLLVLGVLLILD